MKSQQKNYISANFSERMRLVVSSTGLTQKELAEKIGVSEVSLSKYCKGKQIPSRAQLYLLASKLGVGAEWLAGKSNDGGIGTASNDLKPAQEVFFRNLRHLINGTDLKDSQVAAAVGIDKSSLSRYFGQHRIPKKSVLNSLAKFFHVSVSDLLHRDLSSISEIAEKETSVPPSVQRGDDADFATYAINKIAELQQTVNRFTADLLEKYNQLHR